MINTVFFFHFVDCDLFIHLKCKNGIRDHCSREGRRTTGVTSANVLGGILGSIPNLTIDTHVPGNTPNQTNESCNKVPLNPSQIGSSDFIHHGKLFIIFIGVVAFFLPLVDWKI